MLSGYLYKWIDVTDWEFSRINKVTRKLNRNGWELDGVVEGPAGKQGPNRNSGSISLRFRRRAAA